MKEEETISYTQSHTLMVSGTVSMIALCILEYAAYMLYNRQVSKYIANVFDCVCDCLFIELSFVCFSSILG